MTNPKRKKIQQSLNEIKADKFASENMLSEDLAKNIGSLSDKAKITIRLDVRVVEEAKKESEALGVGYQKIINDRLLEIYKLSEADYLKQSQTGISETLEKMEQRIQELEKKQSTA